MVFVTGSNGQLGFEICKALQKRNIKFYGLTRRDFDLTNKSEIIDFFKDKQVTTLIHAAAYTNVEASETQKELCTLVNFEATKTLVDICKVLGCKFVYISSDYVFDGTKSSPYEIYDSLNPINHYGYTKAQGEIYALENYTKTYIIRVSFLYGVNGRNFFKTLLNLSKTRKNIDVVCDQIGSHSYVKHLSYKILDIVNLCKPDIYHLTNEGYFSFYDVAVSFFDKLNVDIKVNKVLSKDYKTVAKRGLNSMLSKECLTKNNIPRLKTVDEGINEFIDEMRL